MKYYALYTSNKIQNPKTIRCIRDSIPVNENLLLFETDQAKGTVESIIEDMAKDLCPLLLIELTKEHRYFFCGKESFRLWLEARVPLPTERG